MGWSFFFVGVAVSDVASEWCSLDGVEFSSCLPGVLVAVRFFVLEDGFAELDAFIPDDVDHDL